MSNKVDIKTRSTIDFGDIGGRLTDAERKVLAVYGRIFRNGFRTAWVGWQYTGRPKRAARNVSFKAWSQTIESREGKATLLLANHARDWRTKTRAYVAYVHRAGSDVIEWRRVWDDLRAEHLGPMSRALAVEISKTILSGGKRAPVKIRTPRADIDPGAGRVLL